MPWNAPLTIGTELKIFVSVYIQIQSEKPLSSFKTRCLLDNSVTRSVTEHFLNNKLISINSSDEIVKGYKYGETIVTIPADDEDFKYKT